MIWQHKWYAVIFGKTRLFLLEYRPVHNPWSQGGKFMVQQMAIASSIPAF